MRLQASINSLLNAPLSGQGAALIAESIIRWPFISNHQVELFWPLRTVMAEMPRLITSMCSVFHGKVAFPFLSSPIKKVYFGGRLSSRSAGKKRRIFQRRTGGEAFERDLAGLNGANFWHSGHNLIFRGGLCRLRTLGGLSGHFGQFRQ
jgi:hypothetical protein